jgi:predicted chitinase
MLISPPFLPPRQTSQSENDWLEAAMQCGQPGDGAFPLSFQLGWHGGVHLAAPITAGTTERVRAIADGTVVYMRAPTPRADAPAHPLNYCGWTDDGCVVLHHHTSIGQGEHAELIEFFSIYMHLAEVHNAIVQGRSVYRKADLGQAGQIYGDTQRKIHFEIVCDDVNLRRLAGRARGTLDKERDGRTDSVYGALYFLIPAGTQVFGQPPVPHLNTPHYQPPRPRRSAPIPPMEPIPVAYTTEAPLIIELRFAQGNGPLPQRGDLTTTTREIIGGRAIAEPLREAEAEYRLYDAARAIANALPGNRAPAQSTVLEMLRFGRTINNTNEAAVTDAFPHWRRIAYPGGTGWVNLNEARIRKYSDADLPEWAGWTLIEDDGDGDSRCNSLDILRWLDLDKSGDIKLSEAVSALTNVEVARKLSKTVCKFPSEWNAATIETRWRWLKTESAANPLPLTDSDFAELKAHINALCIDAAALLDAEWHWHPLEFIRHFRKCTWLSLNELAQLLPRRLSRNPHRPPPITWATATARLQPYHLHLNLALRKFGIVSRERLTHFLAQTYIETALWATMTEFGTGHPQRRANGTAYWPAPAMQFYQAFYGRGAMQLTWAGNFDAYGTYRALPSVPATYTYDDPRISRTSTHYWADPRDQHGVVVHQPKVWWPRYDPSTIATNPFYACDSAGYYWASKNTGGGRTSINRVADQGVTTDAVGRASVLVNGGGYGFAERQGYAAYVERYLGDGTATTEEQAFAVTYRGRNHNVYVNFTPQRPN